MRSNTSIASAGISTVTNRLRIGDRLTVHNTKTKMGNSDQ